jgi:hypothetical protein
MRPFFSSSYIQQLLATHPDRGHVIHFTQSAPDAIKYYLEKEIPNNSTIGLIAPKTILANVLPEIAKRKHCKIALFGAQGEIARAFHDLLSPTTECDIYLCEPELFNPEGAMAHPTELEHLNKLGNQAIIGVGCSLQITDDKPAHLDFIPLTRIVTEKGSINPTISFSF